MLYLIIRWFNHFHLVDIVFFCAPVIERSILGIIFPDLVVSFMIKVLLHQLLVLLLSFVDELEKLINGVTLLPTILWSILSDVNSWVWRYFLLGNILLACLEKTGFIIKFDQRQDAGRHR